jgi:hypothetical protein
MKKIVFFFACLTAACLAQEKQVTKPDSTIKVELVGQIIREIRDEQKQMTERYKTLDDAVAAYEFLLKRAEQDTAAASMPRGKVK